MPRGERYTDAQKETARRLRGEGYTYREIIEALGGGIPKNTISGWVSDIGLTAVQVERIEQIQVAARTIGRPLAAEWHREQKRQRLEEAEAWAVPYTHAIIEDPNALLAFVAGLWLGDGTKADYILEFSNSDPKIIKGWLVLLRALFNLDESKFRIQILINQRMDELECCFFWSTVTNIPITRFIKSHIDSRTGKSEKEGYRGVCRVTYISSALRRQVGSLANAILKSLDKDET